MNLIIEIADEHIAVLKAKATARGISPEQYAQWVLEHELAAGVAP